MKNKYYFLVIFLIAISFIFGLFLGVRGSHDLVFHNGMVYAGRNADQIKAMRAMAILEMSKIKNYDGLEKAINHDLDFALHSILLADEKIANFKIPVYVQNQLDQYNNIIKETFKNDENFNDFGNHLIYKQLAQYRAENPSPIKDAIFDTTFQQSTIKFIEKYKNINSESFLELNLK